MPSPPCLAYDPRRQSRPHRQCVERSWFLRFQRRRNRLAQSLAHHPGLQNLEGGAQYGDVLFARELEGTPIKVNAANPTSLKPGPVATDLSGPDRGEVLARMGYGTPDGGAQTVVHLATLSDEGPSGVFYDINVGGVIPW